MFAEAYSGSVFFRPSCRETKCTETITEQLNEQIFNLSFLSSVSHISQLSEETNYYWCISEIIAAALITVSSFSAVSTAPLHLKCWKSDSSDKFIWCVNTQTSPHCV